MKEIGSDKETENAVSASLKVLMSSSFGRTELTLVSEMVSDPLEIIISVPVASTSKETRLKKAKLTKLVRNVPHDPTPLPPPTPNDDNNMDFDNLPSSPHPDLFDPSLQDVLQDTVQTQVICVSCVHFTTLTCTHPIVVYFVLALLHLFGHNFLNMSNRGMYNS